MAASLNEDCGSPGQGPSGRGPSGRDESTKRTLVLLTDDCAAAEVVGARSRSISPRRSGMRPNATSAAKGTPPAEHGSHDGARRAHHERSGVSPCRMRSVDR